MIDQWSGTGCLSRKKSMKSLLMMYACSRDGTGSNVDLRKLGNLDELYPRMIFSQFRIYKNSEMKEVGTIVILLGVFSSCQSRVRQQAPANTHEPQYFLKVGEMVTARISLLNQNRNLHNYQLSEFGEKEKYLFFKLNSNAFLQNPQMGIYDYKTSKLIFNCSGVSTDTCFVPVSYLSPGQKLTVSVSAQTEEVYNLQSYYSDLEHLIPDTWVEFTFGEEKQNQLFHLQFDKENPAEEVRIILKPKTYRMTFDNVKMYANFDLKTAPTVDKFEFASVHMWNDAEVIIIPKSWAKDHEGLFLYLVGNSETIYLLTCEFTRELVHELFLDETVYDLIEKDQEKSYSLSLKIFEDQIIDELSFKLSLFSGELSVGFYKDKEMSEEYERSPEGYMGDLQYIFKRDQFDKQSQQMYLKLQCPDATATYQVQLQGRKETVAFEVKEDIREFLIIGKAQSKAIFFTYEQFEANPAANISQDIVYSFEANALFMKGSARVDFYSCEAEYKEWESCKNYQDENNFKHNLKYLKPSGTERTGSKVLYLLSLQAKYFKKTEFNSMKVIIISIISEEGRDNYAKLGIEFSNPDKVRHLRQNKALEDRLLASHVKVYKYVNSDPSINKVKIFFNIISGKIFTAASSVDPRLEKIRETPKEQEGSRMLMFTENLTKPIYITIAARINSIFTLSVATEHPNHPQSSAVSLAQGVEYEFKIEPQKSMTVELHPIQQQVILQYKAEGGPVSICQVNFHGLCNQDGGLRVQNTSGKVKIEKGRNQVIQLQLGNFPLPHKQAQSQADNHTVPAIIPRRISVKLSYYQNQSFNCGEKKTSHLYREVISTRTCYMFHLSPEQSYSVRISRIDLGQRFEAYTLCSKLIQPVYRDYKLRVTKEMIRENCYEAANQAYFAILFADLGSIQNLRVEFIIESDSSSVTLEDGVSYTSQTISLSTEKALRTFYYEVIDENQNHEIILRNTMGNQKFYAVLTSKDDRSDYGSTITQNQADFDSADSEYFLNPIITVTPASMQHAKCEPNCLLIISVHSSENAGTPVRYSIEVVSNSIVLKQDEVLKEFVSKGSSRYYEYEARKTGFSLMIRASDNNKHCSKAYLSDSQFPSSTNNLLSDVGGEIIFPNASAQSYYLAIEGLQNCEYTLSVSETNATLTKMLAGEFYDLNLKENSRKVFLIRHISDQSFKIVSLEKHGAVRMYAKQIDLDGDNITAIAEEVQEDLQAYPFKSSYQNTLEISSKSPLFCSDCLYLIVVVAIKATESSIMIANKNIKIPLSKDKQLFDELGEINSTTVATFFPVASGVMKVKVHSGTVNILMTYKNQSFNSTFSTDNSISHLNYSFIRGKDVLRPLEILVTAEVAPALYSLILVPDQAAKQIERISLGEHASILISKEKQCISGYLNKRDEEIILTVKHDQALKLSSLIIDAKTGEDRSKASISREIVGNIMTLKFEFESIFFRNAEEYEICFSLEGDQQLPLTVFQNEFVNLLPTNTEILIKEENTFVIHPQGEFIVDVFACRGSPEIRYATKEDQLEQVKKSNHLELGIPGQSHAVRFEKYQTMFLQVKAELATMLWMQLDHQKEIGVGYFRYRAGDLEFNQAFNAINFVIGGVTQIEETRTRPAKIVYRLYISNDKEKLNQAILCEKVDTQSVRQMVYADSPKVNESVTIQLSKQALKQLLGPNKTVYFNAVADVALNPAPQKEDGVSPVLEHYKFVYNYKYVPSDVFAQSNIQSLPVAGLILLVMVTVAGIVLIFFMFAQLIVPAIGKLKNRMFVEEEERDQNEPVPPSSDRNDLEMKNHPKPGTEEEMHS